MKCGLCAFEFDEARAGVGCGGCGKPAGHQCCLVRCPKCGYSVPPEPKWIKNLKKKLGEKL